MLDWKKMILKANSSLLDALKVINEVGGRICLVTDNYNKLIGVITDGDIRRALLKSIELDSPVNLIMNRTPITVSKNNSRAAIVKIMQEKGIIAVPVVDEDNTLIGLDTWNYTSGPQRYQNPVFIMAGGLGTRLRPLTDNCPKPMLKIGDKPILERLLNQFSSVGFNNIYISTHFMPEQITNYFGDGSKWGVNIKYIHEDTPLGTGGALGLLPNDMPKLPLIMINGDVLTTIDFEQLLEFHNKHNPSATMCVREYNYQIPYGVVSGNGYKVISMEEKPIHKSFINAGIYVVSPEIIINVPKNKRIDMPGLLEKEIFEKRDVAMFPLHEYWLDIGRVDDFNRAQIDIQSLVKGNE